MICTYYYTQVFRKKLVWLQKIWTLAYILSLYFDCWWHFFSLPITALTVVVHPLYLLKHDVIYSNVLLHNIYTLLHCVCSYFVASFYVKSIHRNDFSKKVNLFCTTSRGWLSTKTIIFTCFYLSITRFFSGILLFFKSKRIL